MINLYSPELEMQLLGTAQKDMLQKLSKLSPLLAETYNSNPQPWHHTIIDLSIFLLPFWVEDLFQLEGDDQRREKLISLNFTLSTAFAAADQMLWCSNSASTRSSAFSIMALTTHLLEAAWDLISGFSQQNSSVRTYGALYLEDTWAAYAMEDVNLLQPASTLSAENLLFVGQRLSWLKAGPMILAVLSGNESRGQTLAESLQPLLAGLVLEHNVVQWKDDLRLGRKTPVTSVLRHVRPVLVEIPDGALDRPCCAGLLSALTAAADLYKKSLEMCLPLESKALSRFLANRLTSVDRLRAELKAKLAWQNAMERISDD